MKFIIDQKDFQQALNVVQKGLSGKNLMEVLKGIHIEALNNELILTTNNLELGILTKVEANVQEEGKVLVEGKIFSDIIRKLPSEQLTVTVGNDDVINIKSNRTKFNIKAMVNNRFPLLEEYEDDKYQTIDSKVFSDMIKKTYFAASHDDARGVLTGELLEITDNSVAMVAIDGFRLAIKTLKSNLGLHNHRAVIPVKTLQEIQRLIEGTENFGVFFEDRSISFKIENTIINSRLLDGDFINYSQIIPKEFITRIKIKNKDFVDSLDRATVVSNNNLVILNINDDNLKISAKNSEIGNLEEFLNIDLEGKELEIAFNIRYFTEALKNIDDEYIYMSFNTNISPCVIEPESDEDYLYLLLPVRI